MKLNDLFESTPLHVRQHTGILGIAEAGVGRVIPGVNTTPDVGPNEIKKQARKLGMKVDRDGRPPIARTNGKID